MNTRVCSFLLFSLCLVPQNVSAAAKHRVVSELPSDEICVGAPTVIEKHCDSQLAQCMEYAWSDWISCVFDKDTERDCSGDYSSAKRGCYAQHQECLEVDRNTYQEQVCEPRFQQCGRDVDARFDRCLNEPKRSIYECAVEQDIGHMECARELARCKRVGRLENIDDIHFRCVQNAVVPQSTSSGTAEDGER